VAKAVGGKKKHLPSRGKRSALTAPSLRRSRLSVGKGRAWLKEKSHGGNSTGRAGSSFFLASRKGGGSMPDSPQARSKKKRGGSSRGGKRGGRPNRNSMLENPTPSEKAPGQATCLARGEKKRKAGLTKKRIGRFFKKKKGGAGTRTPGKCGFSFKEKKGDRGEPKSRSKTTEERTTPGKKRGGGKVAAGEGVGPQRGRHSGGFPRCGPRGKVVCKGGQIKTYQAKKKNP